MTRAPFDTQRLATWAQGGACLGSDTTENARRIRTLAAECVEARRPTMPLRVLKVHMHGDVVEGRRWNGTEWVR